MVKVVYASLFFSSSSSMNWMLKTRVLAGLWTYSGLSFMDKTGLFEQFYAKSNPNGKALIIEFVFISFEITRNILIIMRFDIKNYMKYHVFGAQGIYVQIKVFRWYYLNWYKVISSLTLAPHYICKSTLLSLLLASLPRPATHPFTCKSSSENCWFSQLSFVVEVWSIVETLCWKDHFSL